MNRQMGRRQQLAQTYIKEHISRCPICKNRQPEWAFSYTEFLQDRNIQYKCSRCGCVLSTDYGDLKGVGGTVLTDFLRGNANYDAMVRSVYGKKKGVVYVRILDPGTCAEAAAHKGKEFPLEELKEMFW